MKSAVACVVVFVVIVFVVFCACVSSLGADEGEKKKKKEWRESLKTKKKKMGKRSCEYKRKTRTGRDGTRREHSNSSRAGCSSSSFQISLRWWKLATSDAIMAHCFSNYTPRIPSPLFSSSPPLLRSLELESASFFFLLLLFLLSLLASVRPPFPRRVVLLRLRRGSLCHLRVDWISVLLLLLFFKYLYLKCNVQPAPVLQLKRIKRNCVLRMEDSELFLCVYVWVCVCKRRIRVACLLVWQLNKFVEDFWWPPLARAPLPSSISLPPPSPPPPPPPPPSTEFNSRFLCGLSVAWAPVSTVFTFELVISNLPPLLSSRIPSHPFFSRALRLASIRKAHTRVRPTNRQTISGDGRRQWFASGFCCCCCCCLSSHFY